MITINLELPKELEQHLIYLEAFSKRPKEFIIQEALIQYIEDMEDIQRLSILSVLEKKHSKTYTDEELDKKLTL